MDKFQFAYCERLDFDVRVERKMKDGVLGVGNLEAEMKLLSLFFSRRAVQNVVGMVLSSVAVMLLAGCVGPSAGNETFKAYDGAVKPSIELAVVHASTPVYISKVDDKVGPTKVSFRWGGFRAFLTTKSFCRNGLDIEVLPGAHVLIFNFAEGNTVFSTAGTEVSANFEAGKRYEVTAVKKYDQESFFAHFIYTFLGKSRRGTLEYSIHDVATGSETPLKSKHISN
ncbi:MAG: hypothetical protein NTY53_17725 [Kiritimatiellaeota bacterium]|nr:hypothetical protein [Kiritimatiellota bacterium]